MRRVTGTQINQNDIVQNKSKRTLLSTTAMIAGALLISSQANAQSIPANSWDYDVVLDGNVAKDTSVAGITDITVGNGNGFVKGNADIHTGHTVNVTGDSGSTFAYRDNRKNIESTLNGNLNSNMSVVIIDKDGLFFGENFNADVQSIIGTSGKVKVSDIMDGGDLLIKKVKKGGNIILNGTVSVQEAGLAAFVAPTVINNGIINAKLARVQIGAAKKVTVDLHGDGLVELALDGKLKNALVENNGQILAEGGIVQMTALAAKNTVDNIVNNTGVINASSASVSGGKIILSGGKHGTVRNAGSISTSEGGSVNISGKHFVQENNAPKYELNKSAIVPKIKPSAQPYIKTAGGDVDIQTRDDVKIRDGYIDAQGGNIDIKNKGSFYSDNQNTLRTSGTGTIELNQNNPYKKPAPKKTLTATVTPTIQNAIDAVDNTGTGSNTINVGAGTYYEAVEANHANLILNGNNAGNKGAGARSPETTIIPNSPGIHITSDNVTVDGFSITGADEGILVSNANKAKVLNNIVTNSLYGVFVEGSNNVVVDSNSIDETKEGVHGENAGNFWVHDNDITNSSVAGIHVKDSDGTNYINDIDIWKNRIDGKSGSTGIKIENSAYATVGGYINNQFGEADSIATGNVITGVKNGVFIKDSYGAIAIYNTVDDVTDKAIRVSDSHRSKILNNVATNAKYGAFVEDSNNVVVDGNSIDETKEGVHGENAGNFWVHDNDITNSSVAGIHVKDSDGTNYINDIDIWKNRIDGKAGSTGIKIENSAYATVGGYINHQFSEPDSIATGNVVTGVKNGIVVKDSYGAIAIYNTVDDVADKAIRFSDSNSSKVLNNVVTDAKYGAFIKDSNNVIVEGNNISETTEGVHGENVSDFSVINNNITDSSRHGVHIDGPNNGLVTFQGNNLTDNGQSNGTAAARFESGDIDMSDLSNPNIFTNTTGLAATAMQFIDTTDEPASLQNEAVIPPSGNGLRIVNETLGSTVFDGYLPEESFYVRFEDGSILDELTSEPIIIDGNNASFDGVSAPLTAGELDFIEDRLYDADDAPIDGRGQIFGVIPTTLEKPKPLEDPIEDFSSFQDIFRETQFADNLGAGTNLIITGLPPISGFSFNNIEPAAGGASEVQKLANLEPAAGGNGNGTQNVTCIGDALGSISNGAVSYNFGGSFEDSILGAASCSTIRGL